MRPSPSRESCSSVRIGASTCHCSRSTSFVLSVAVCSRPANLCRYLVAHVDVDHLPAPLRLGSVKIDGEKAIDQVRPATCMPSARRKTLWNWRAGDTAMQEHALLVFGLPAPDDQLPPPRPGSQLLAGKARDSQRDPEGLGSALGPCDPLYIVGRIAVRRRPGGTRPNARSISSNPSRNGEFKVGMRDIVEPSRSQVAFVQGSPEGAPRPQPLD